MRLHDSKRNRYKQSTFGSDHSVMKSTSLGDENTFQSVSRLSFNVFPRNFTPHKSCARAIDVVSLVVIGE
jgi:hypothetical protein